MDPAVLTLSLALAGSTTLALLLLGLPLASWLVASKARWKVLVEAVVALPIVLPPTVLGFYLLVLLGPATPLGRAFAAVAGHPFPFSFTGLLAASILYSLPFAVQPFATALAAVDPRMVESAHALGASRHRTFLLVTLPLAWRGVVAGSVLAFAHTVGEFGVVLMVGGNIPGETRTLSIALYDQVQALEYGAAHRTAALLIGSALVVLVVVSILQRRSSLAWNGR